MPDAYVFPGGAVDAADRDLAARAADRDLAARDADRNLAGAPPEIAVAALRELFEEAGVLLARDARGEPVAFDAPALASLRDEHAASASFAALLDRHSLALDREALAYYSNWITPESEPVRFDTHFFVARAPAGQSAAADAVEVHDGVWISPADALAAGARGAMTIPFPTQKHLERLTRFDDVDALVAHARTRRVVAVRPVPRDDGSFALDDAW